jgi:predicted GNAT family acetyltransferase
MIKIRKGKSLYAAYDCHNSLVLPASAEDCINKDSLVWYANFGTPPLDVVAGYATARVMGDFMFLNSAGVKPAFRGQGLHKRLIKVRLAYAKRHDLPVITYTSLSNTASSNNLIHCGFKLYLPENAWVGKDYLYWRTQ